MPASDAGQEYAVASRRGDGMPTVYAVSFDHLRVVAKAYLVDRFCSLDSTRPVEAELFGPPSVTDR
jgi:hypothetical protein